MVLVCFYDESDGKIHKLVRSKERGSLSRHKSLVGKKGVVVKCPKELYHMHPSKIRQECRVKSESNGLVELEYARR